eukprot:scaffold39900_cov35-Attheya_sp.AAC.1
MRLTTPTDLSTRAIKRNTKQEILAAFDFISAHATVESMDARKVPSSSAETEMRKDTRLPTQQDGNNCGVLSMYYMLCKTFGKSPNSEFGSPVHCSKFRRALAQFFVDASYTSHPRGDDKAWIQPLLFVPPTLSQANET